MRDVWSKLRLLTQSSTPAPLPLSGEGPSRSNTDPDPLHPKTKRRAHRKELLDRVKRARHLQTSSEKWRMPPMDDQDDRSERDAGQVGGRRG